jgi:hypothetical protein
VPNATKAISVPAASGVLSVLLVLPSSSAPAGRSGNAPVHLATRYDAFEDLSNKRAPPSGGARTGERALCLQKYLNLRRLSSISVKVAVILVSAAEFPTTSPTFSSFSHLLCQGGQLSGGL